jgi:HK97 family phage prohead protease
MTIEYRTSGVIEVRADGEAEGRIVADVLAYNVIDSYGTRFAPGTFTKSLSRRMPRMLWVHNLGDPIGAWVDADDNAKRLRLSGQLDLGMIPGTDTPAVPRAHQALEQFRSGSVDQFSVGFIREADEDGGDLITRASLEETSATPVGSVPGTKLVSIRTPGMVDIDAVVELARRKSAGQLTQAEAVEALALIAGGEELPVVEVVPEEVVPDPDTLAALAETAAQLADR